MLDKVGWLDRVHTPSQIAKQYLRHFPGLVEMMPDPLKRPGEAYFDPAFWPSGGAKPNNQTLADALDAKGALPAPDARFYQIIGHGQETVVAATKSASELHYQYSTYGDGTVPVDLAQVDTVPQYFVEGTHTGMLQRRDVARAVHQLIQDGTTHAISSVPPVRDIRSEAQTLQRSDDDLRRINRSTPRAEIPNALDILSEFLAPGSLPADADTTASARQVDPHTQRNTILGEGDQDMERKIGGYPLSVLLQTSKAWRGIDDLVENGALNLRHRETEQRKRKYAARKLNTLLATAEETPKRRILPDRLQKLIEVAESNRSDAIDALLDERVMGEAEEFLSVLYLKRAPIVSKSVARVIRRNTENGFGTGFMVAPGVLMTNHHVLPDDWAAKNAAAQFDHEINYQNRAMAPVRFNFRPDLLFYANKDLDFALVAVDAVDSEMGQRVLEDFGYLPLDGAEGKIEIGKPINIIQHPNAETKQAVFRDAVLQDLPANDLPADAHYRGAPKDIAAHYSADTKRGSSGSPVLNSDWEVIALHHSSVVIVRDGAFRMKDGTFLHPNQIIEDRRDKDVDWIANEGIRISRIIKHLQNIVDAQTTSARERIMRVLQVGLDAKENGHFNRPMPRYVLDQFEETVTEEHAPPPPAAALYGAEAQVNALAIEGLLDFLRNALMGGAEQPAPATGTQTSSALTVDTAGVAQGSGDLVLTYRGDATSPYGRSATAHRQDFSSVVLHHNAPNLSTDWLIQYQIDGDAVRGGHFGYHFYIAPNGVIFQGAPMNKRTNHVKPPTHTQRKSFGRIASNSSSIGITCVKAAPHYSPTTAQIISQDKLVQALAGAYGFSFANVFGHGEVQSDRDHREGTPQAQKIRGWAMTGLGTEAVLSNDETDDTALEMLSAIQRL
jgi:V8-like Glu-specific endopeptidase